MWKMFIHGYLRFSRKERTGILLLVALILLTCKMPDLLFYFQRIPVSDTSNFSASIAAYEAYLTKTSIQVPACKTDSLFYFDPNTLPVAGWRQLGVSTRTAQIIQHYLARGGQFLQATDLQKIYGLPPSLSMQLIPYVQIDRKKRRNSGKLFASYDEAHKNRYYQLDTVHRTYGTFSNATSIRYKKELPDGPIDINKADTLAWQTLPGIGIRLACRLTAFRAKLGGFYSVKQVAECFGLPDSTFKKIQPFLSINDSSLTKIDLNQADENFLAAHPYIRYKLAHFIVQYRSVHGTFRHVSELRSIPLVDEIIYRKIEPYLEINL